MEKLRTIQFDARTARDAGCKEVDVSHLAGTYVHIDDYNAAVAKASKLTTDIDRLITKLESVEKKLAELIRSKESNEQHHCRHVGYGG